MSCFCLIGSFAGADRAQEKQFFTDRLLCVYIPWTWNHTVYIRKWAYRFKTAFPEPYPLQKRSLSAKNKLSDRQWHQKVSKIISSINYMKKMAMQRNNREAIRQNANSYSFVEDAGFFITRHTLHCGDVHRRLHNKENKLFRTVWAVLAIVFDIL